jgi:hypothetical protein
VCEQVKVLLVEDDDVVVGEEELVTDKSVEELNDEVVGFILTVADECLDEVWNVEMVLLVVVTQSRS